MFRPLSMFNRNRNLPVSRDDYTADPFFHLHREMNRLFEDAFPSFSAYGLPAAFGDATDLRQPRLDMRETDDSIEIEAELPGVAEDDLAVHLHDDVLTIRGEKKFERSEGEKKGDFHVMERAYGSFTRSLRLPYPVAEDAVEARFRDGVLKITLPKPKDAGKKARRIEIRRD